MPIYEYQCASCHHHFEIMQKISDQPVHQCPKCYQDKAERIVSAAGFQLKGTGWYATDFKNKGTKPAGPESTTTAESAKSTPEATASPKSGDER